MHFGGIRRAAVASALAGVLCHADPSLADAPRLSGSGDHAGLIEELVVTARKRSEPLLEVPASITVVDAEALEAMNAVRLDDVALRLPNLATNASPLTGFGGRYVRGLNAGARNIGFDSGYAVFVDGVYAGRYVTADRVLQDVERIEYLPGPQGTLFGKNTTLGVVNVVTRTPASAPAGTLSVGVGSDGHREGRVHASSALGGGWTGSAAAAVRERDGLVENRFLDTRGNEVDHHSARVAVSGELAGWTTTLTGDYFRSTPALIPRQRLEGFGALPPRTAANDLPEAVDDEDRGVALTAERPLGDARITSITAYRRFDTTASVDDDAWELPVQHLLDWSERTEQLSQELRLDGSRGRLDYLLGAYLLDLDARSSRSVASFFGQARADGEVASDTYALFGTLGWAVSPRLAAELGLRWTRESKDLAHYAQDGGGVLIDFTQQDERTVTSVTPTASLSYALDDDVTAYARYARGFKSGGFNVDLVTAPALTPLEFDDERVETVEAGVRSVWLRGRLRFDLAVFRSEYRDLQVSQYEVLPGATLPTLRITNAATAHTQGVELGAEALLGPWLLSASVGQTHGEVDDFPDPLGPGTGNYAGNSLGGPEWTTSLLARYGRDLGWAELTVTAEHLFQDALGGDLDDDPLSRSDALSEVNLRLALAFGEARRWRVSAWVDNLFDTERVVERHRTAVPGLLALLGYPPEIADSTVGLYNDPRTFGLELAVTL